MREITVNSDFTLPVRSEKQIASNVLKGSLGNLIEWFDWYVYASFAIYFSGAFFPAHNPTAQLLAAAGVFAIGFFMRPLGSLIMGRLADRHGRRTALTVSVLIMATGSLIIAFVPTYATIGIWSPLILIVTRLLQGLSEMASPHHRGFYASFQYVTLIAGQLFALLVQIVLQNCYTNAQLTAFGWRIPFGIGAIGALVVLWLRLSMEESDQFTRRNQHQAKAGTLRLLMRYPKQIVIVIMMTLGGTICFYTYTTYLQQFMINSVGMAKEQVALINFAALLVMIILQPLFGALSDRIGRRPLLIFFGLGATLGTVPLFTLLSHTTKGWQALGLMVGALVIVSGYTSINAIVKAELFPSEIRALGVGLPYGLTVALFGGTVNYVALWLRSLHHESLFFWYVSLAAAISLYAYVFLLKAHLSQFDADR